nr:1,4-dihydroxy-2-naphthoyl-CoA thioesterase 1-like [Ipomoea batatas]
MNPSSSSSKSKTETLDRTLHAVGFEIGELTPSKVTEIKDRDIGSDTPRRGVRDRRADAEQGDGAAAGSTGKSQNDFHAWTLSLSVEDTNSKTARAASFDIPSFIRNNSSNSICDCRSFANALTQFRAGIEMED